MNTGVVFNRINACVFDPGVDVDKVDDIAGQSCHDVEEEANVVEKAEGTSTECSYRNLFALFCHCILALAIAMSSGSQSQNHSRCNCSQCCHSNNRHEKHRCFFSNLGDEEFVKQMAYLKQACSQIRSG